MATGVKGLTGLRDSSIPTCVYLICMVDGELKVI